MNIKSSLSIVGRFFKRLGMLTILLAAITGVGASVYLYPKFLITSAQASKLEAAAKVVADKEEADQCLGQYVINLMYKSPKTVKEVSPAAQQVLAMNIVRDTGHVMVEDVFMKHFFIGAIQYESQFLKYAQSPTGPKRAQPNDQSYFSRRPEVLWNARRKRQ